MEQQPRPFKAQKKTRLQGTVLKLFDYHCHNTGLKDAQFLRQLVIDYVTERYEINNGGGIVKIKR